MTAPVITPERAAALAALTKRRQDNKTRERVDNSALRAGEPMHFDCIACDGDIVVPEDYVIRPRLCVECRVLGDFNWLEE